MNTTRTFSWRDQAVYVTAASLTTTTLFLARGLQPSAQGFGTHEQLGLPPCAFFTLTGLPCPSCGMTTCFAHAAKFHFAEALAAQPFGLLVFFLAVFLIPATMYLLRVRVPVKSIVLSSFVRQSVPVLLGLYLLGWTYKLAVLWP
ncbi:MAG: DUF2752 domain-containing protein [Acidobacteria bacterium]|nr:DUF2752 domain-containing protein [Acidobacteriota bacterium]